MGLLVSQVSHDSIMAFLANYILDATTHKELYDTKYFQMKKPVNYGHLYVYCRQCRGTFYVNPTSELATKILEAKQNGMCYRMNMNNCIGPHCTRQRQLITFRKSPIDCDAEETVTKVVEYCFKEEVVKEEQYDLFKHKRIIDDMTLYSFELGS